MRKQHVVARVCLWGILAVAGAVQAHDLGFDSDPLSSAINVGSKNYNGAVDQVFRDGLGREASFRGWNVSGSAKLAETGHQPFRNLGDAQDAFDTLGEQFGPNVVRFLITWEGVNPAMGQIDNNYLAQVTQEIRMAAANHMYVLLDFHQDLYDRYVFNMSSWNTADGAPKYATRTSDLGAEYCGLICVSWGQNMLTNAPLRQTMNDFWYNNTVNGVPVQGSFLSAMGSTLAYIRSHLSDAEFNYVIGLDPWNEPFDGGMGSLSAAQWENTYLWGFHQRARAVMDANGWSAKPEFSELLVWWNSATGPIIPATGGYNLTLPPGNRYVFNAHFYDQLRIGGLNSATVNNGTYFGDIDSVRKVARYWGSPAFLSEFGMSADGTGAQDPNRITNGVYQALEASDGLQSTKTRFLDPYVSLVSGTEWQWDYYWNRHHEYMNGNSSKLLTANDAWNGENYSVIGDNAGVLNYNLSANVTKRLYPRRAQGDVMSFFANALGTDKKGSVMQWGALRPRGAGMEYLRNNAFGLLVWRGRSSEAPGEMYIPNTLDPSRLVVVTDKTIRSLSGVDASLLNQPNEVDLLADNVERNSAVAGHRLLVWNDTAAGEDANTWHYALVFQKNAGETWSTSALQTLQAQLNATIKTSHLSPVYLAGSMTNSGYPADTAP